MADQSTAPRLTVPAAACDAHMHIYDGRYPLAPTALGAPADASVEDYRAAIRERLGITRTVVVQPTAYGTDNRCTLAAIAALGSETTRGIAVVDDVSDDELARLTRGGMRGVRFQMLPGGALPWAKLPAIAARVQAFGWHIQLQTDGRNFPLYEKEILSWPGTIVIDHVGKFLEPVLPDHDAFRSLLRLIDTGRVFLKLSAPYEVSKVGPPGYDDVGRLAKACVKAAPERMLWASNWPHPSVAAKPDDAVLLDLLLDWVPDEATRRLVLVDTPAKLYGF